MRAEKIWAAQREAARFAETANKLMKLPAQERDDALYKSKLSGALRRSSLDLTRALAEMRKP